MGTSADFENTKHRLEDFLKSSLTATTWNMTGLWIHFGTPYLIGTCMSFEVEDLHITLPIATKSHDEELQAGYLISTKVCRPVWETHLWESKQQKFMKKHIHENIQHKENICYSFQSALVFPIEGRVRILMPSFESMLKLAVISAVAIWMVKLIPESGSIWYKLFGMAAIGQRLQTAFDL